MNAVLDAWNNADESRRDGGHARVLRRTTLGSANGRAAPHRNHRRVERSGRSRVGHDGGARLDGSLRVPPAHRRTQGCRRIRKFDCVVRQEQAGTNSAADNDHAQNSPKAMRSTKQRFGFTYIVCATGKSAEEMLAILKRRLANDRVTELREAAEQQRQIMQIRLGKWLVS